MLLFNRKLTDSGVLKLAAWLTALQPAFTPAECEIS
jgi:hypothetical protein